MSELAYDLNGEPIALPASAQWWKVRRFRNPGTRGAPEVVVDRDGGPLMLPIDTSFVEFREQTDGVPGRYRLDPLDEHRRVVANVPAAYVTLAEVPRKEAPVHVADDRDAVIRELVRAQADMVKAMSEKFSDVMKSAAELLRAADGAGLPARPPMAIVDGGGDGEDDDEEDDDEGEEVAVAAPAGPAGIDLNALVAQVVPVIVMSLVNGKFDLSKLGELFDWRKAAASGKAAANSNAAAPIASPAGNVGASGGATTAKGVAAGIGATANTAAGSSEGAGVALPPLDPAAMAHFIAVQSALTPDEGAMAREIAKELSPTELRLWFDELAAMSVPDAVAKIRSILGGTRAAGGAS